MPVATIAGLAITLFAASAGPAPKGAASFAIASSVSEFQEPRFGEALAAAGPVLFVGGAFGSDVGFEGWYIDDFLLETCVD